MVLKHNKRSFGAEEPWQPSCKHNIRRLNCGGRLASFAGISSFIDEGGKEVASQLQGESRVEGYPQVTCSVAKDEKPKTTGFAVVSKDHCNNGCHNISSLLGENNCDVVRPEYGRQILCEDGSFQLGCAEFDQDFQLHLFSEILPVNSIHERSLVSALPVATCEEMPADDTNLSGPPSLSWHTFNTHEETIHLESPGGACFFPYIEDDHQLFECNLFEEITSSVLNYPYQMPIATGPKYQANIPVWRPDEFQSYVGKSDDSEDTPADDNPSSTLSFSWHTCNTYEEGSRLESPVGASFIPYFEDDHRIVGHNHLEETCSSTLDYYERKPVAIGPHHQADIPVCGFSEFDNSVEHSDDSVSSTSNSVDLSSSSAHLVSEEDLSDKWTGTCILPMPDYGTLSLEVKGRSCQNLCNCLDMGSTRCVRQHVVESRVKLEQALGHEKFMMLGFGDMGEVVAQKWSTEEEQAFQEVVMANPASLGKNFWNDLRHVFMSRSSKELISYYFNVFMLRKRAEQNRMDPMNADSDNDEWQESNESVAGDGEEDSVVESPHDGDNVMYNDGDATDVHELTEGLYTCDGEDYGPCDLPENHNGNKLQPISDAYLSEKNFEKGMEEQDVQDDLCTSYDGEQSGADT